MKEYHTRVAIGRKSQKNFGLANELCYAIYSVHRSGLYDKRATTDVSQGQAIEGWLHEN